MPLKKAMEGGPPVREGSKQVPVINLEQHHEESRTLWKNAGVFKRHGVGTLKIGSSHCGPVKHVTATPGEVGRKMQESMPSIEN